MNLNKKIKSFLNQHKKTKKRLSATALLSLLIAIAVVSSLIMPAISMTLELAAGLSSVGLMRSSENTLILGASSNMITNAYGDDANDGKSPKELSDVILLIGDGTDWAEGCNSAAEVIEAAKAKYFLGIASDFCVFLEKDFKPKNSDAEGRVAAGGDVIFQSAWNYQIGNGDYASGTALTKTDNYLEKSNFAHLITKGKVQKINTISQGKEGDDKFIYEDDTYKRFVVGSAADLTNVENYYHLTWPNNTPTNTPYTDSCNHDDVYYNEIASFYKADLINFTEVFEWLRGQSEKLSRKTATGTASVSNGVLTLTGQGADSGAATVYFSLDSWDSSINEINYVNVPDKANLVLNCGGGAVSIDSGTNKVKTTINGTEISNTGTTASNNHEKSEQILYNFYEAANVYVDTNFNGTILAPNADAKSHDDCHGHLSGSLIAKSFEGGLEFGYRPYRGTASDILGSTAGYAIPVNKFTENANEYLPGASFVMKDEEGKTVDSWTSTTGTDYINIPSKVDFEGKTLYNDKNNVCQSTFYTFSERASPDGYVLNSEKTYQVNIKETVEVSSLIYSDDHSVSIPTKVDSDIQLKYGDQVLGSWKIEILDTYANTNGVTSQTQRRVTIKDTNDNIIDTFYLDISNNLVTLAGHGTGAISTTTWKETVTSVSSSETDVVTSVETVVPVTSVVSATDADNSVVTDANGSAVTETVTVTSASTVTDENNNPVTENGEVVTTYVPVTETSYYESSYTSYTDVIVTSEIELSKETQSTVKIPISNLSEAQNITVDESRNYRYVPQSLMIMPLPASVPDFVNKPGFVFRKVDGSGALLTGADISLQEKADSGETYSDVTWDWTTSNSKITIDPEKLTKGRIYRFHENAPPAGYETASDIYFIKTETAIKYANSEDELDSGGTSITISSAVPVADRTITMTDIKMSGAALILKKVDSSNNSPLSGAKFRLYAADGETGIPVYPLAEGESFEVTDGQINLFNMLRNAAAGTYDTSYAENGYLKEGTYYLEEVSSPSGFVQPTEPFYFTIKQSDSGYVIEAGKPQYIAFTLNNTSHATEVFADGSASNVTKIEIYVDEPTSGTLEFWEHSTVNGKTASIVNGVATLTFDSPQELGRFKIQNKPYNDGLTVKEVRVYGDSSGSSSSSGTAYSIKDIVWNDDAFPAVTVSKLTFYYADADPQEVKDISVTQNQWWHSFNLSGFSKKDNVIGIEIEVGGSGTGKLVVQASDGSLILGNQSDQWTKSYTTVTAGNTYTLGSTTVPQTPSEPDNPGTSTEESAGTITAEGMTITIGNDKAGSTVSLSVEKVWSGDTGYENLRPESITVQLKRSTSADTSSPEDGFLEAVTLNADNNWKYTWPKQDRLQSDGVTPYYYFVEEISVPSGYTVGYTNNDGLTEGGKITITNTCITKDYAVQKVWDTKGISGVIIPTSITVKLQSSSDNGATWQDVSGKTLTLTAENSWQGKFESLPDSAGIKYRAVETKVPTGWTSESSTAADGTMTVTNTIKVGSLLVKKLWNDNESTGSRPSSIKLNLYRSTTPPSGSGGSTSGTITPSASTGVTDDYGRLLQYSLYFYDAQMCGSDVKETSAVSWRDDCAVSYDLSSVDGIDTIDGGYHDAADHIMFGLPQGFTASTLGWSYYEFKDSFDSLGTTEHYRTIMKRFCDFFVNSTALDSSNNVKNFVYQKGNGGTEHSKWGPPEIQMYHDSQIYTTQNSASDIAADYAAALAQYALNFPDDVNSAVYLRYAKALYEFSVKYNSRATEGTSGFYYDDTGSCNDEQAWAAAWLYLATNDSSYKTACKTKLNACGDIPKRGHFWDNVTLGAETVYASYIADESDSTKWNKVEGFLQQYCTDPNTYLQLDNWASARHNTLTQIVALAHDKNKGTTTYQEWCRKQMAYILGENSFNKCFVVGFADNSASSPHHRAASNLADDSSWSKWNSWNGLYSTMNGSHVLVGALVGGTNGSSFNDNCKDHKGNEVALDYNAGLVGAAAGLFYVYHTGIPEDKAAFESKFSGNDAVSYKDTWSGTSSSISSLSSSEPLVALALSPAEEAEIETATSAKLESSVNQLAMMTLKAEACYPPVTTIGEVKTTPKTFSMSYENVTRIEVDYQFDQSNGGGNLTFNDWNIQSKTSIDSDTYGYTLQSPTNIYNFCVQGIWNASSVTISEIRFYYESASTVQITPSSATLKIGDATQLTATGAPSGSVTWSSSDTNIATVDANGNVTAVSGGAATITAADSTDSTATATASITVSPMTFTAEDAVVGQKVTYSVSNQPSTASKVEYSCEAIDSSGKASKSGTYTVTATAKDSSGNIITTATAQINISALKITGTSTMEVGGTQTLSLNRSGNFTWTSSNENVATVDSSGNVKALKYGTTTITATEGEYSANFEITVNNASISLGLEPAQIRVGGTAALSPNIEIANYDYDSTLISITGNTITGLSAGDATITAKAADGQKASVVLKVVGQLNITGFEGCEPGFNAMNLNSVQKLAVENAIGTLSWTSSDDTVITVDNGTVTSLKDGKATITVTDSYDNKTSSFEIEVKPTAVSPDIPEGIAFYKQIELTAGTNWQQTVADLPITDENGNRYYYYIAEIDSSGNIASSIQGNNAYYIPVSYIGNGSAVSDTGTPEISVTNSMTEKQEGELPLTGGEGTAKFYYTGGALVLLSAFVGGNRFRRRFKERRTK